MRLSQLLTQKSRINSQGRGLNCSRGPGLFFSPPPFPISTNSRARSVSSVHPDRVIYSMKDKVTGELTEHEIPANFVLWSTGIAMNPFTSKVAGYLPNQVHKKAIEVDSHLRVKGAPLGDVYAIGDCATVSGSSSLYRYFLSNI